MVETDCLASVHAGETEFKRPVTSQWAETEPMGNTLKACLYFAPFLWFFRIFFVSPTCQLTWYCSFYWSSHPTHEDYLSSNKEVCHFKHIPFQSLDWRMFCDVLSKGKINSCNSFVSLLVAAEKSVCPTSLGYKNSTQFFLAHHFILHTMLLCTVPLEWLHLLHCIYRM